jgi:large subunit ribosomal protein L1
MAETPTTDKAAPKPGRAKRSKRYRKLEPLVDRGRRYALADAAALVRSFGSTKFDQTVNLAICLSIDPKKADQAIRGAFAFPNGIGKNRKVIVFADGEDVRVAQEAGADEVGAEELVKKVGDGWLDFDVAIALPRMMKHVGKLGKVLGPQGKMPSPKSGTVTDDLKTAVREFKAGKVEFRADAQGNVHVPVGKVSFAEPALRENIQAFLDHLQGMRPASVKGSFIRNAVLSATMSPGIPLAWG